MAARVELREISNEEGNPSVHKYDPAANRDYADEVTGTTGCITGADLAHLVSGAAGSSTWRNLFGRSSAWTRS
jgi:uncharacterized protein (DUF2252 family)